MRELYGEPDIVAGAKTRRLRWAGYVYRREEESVGEEARGSKTFRQTQVEMEKTGSQGFQDTWNKRRRCQRQSTIEEAT